MILDARPEPQPVPEPGLTRDEVESLIEAIPGYDDEQIKGGLLRVTVHSNGLADHLGAPRIRG